MDDAELLRWEKLRAGWERIIDLPSTWRSGRLCAGDRILLVGPNSCGKSTLLFALMGALPRIEGSIYIKGRSVDCRIGPDQRLESGMSIVPQGGHCFERLTYKQNINLLAGDAGEFQYGPFSNRLDGKLNMKMNGASGGERQIVALERAWRSGADILLLDEPWNALDAEATSALDHALQTFSGAVIAVRHILSYHHALEEGWNVLHYEVPSKLD